MTPEASAGFFSSLTFGWMTAILSLGYARPLEISDLYALQDERSASRIGKLIEESFERRRESAEDYNRKLEAGTVKPGWRVVWWTLLGNRAEREKHWRNGGGQRHPSLFLALNDSVKRWFWSAGLLKIICDTLTILSPLLVQVIINFASDSYTARSQGEKPPPLWKGVLLALALFAMQFIASFCQHHYWYRASTTGVLLRGGLIAAIYSRTFRLSSRARVSLPNGLLLTHIASDASRIDVSAGLAHIAWTSLVQIMISLVILLVNLGPSALAGFSLFLMGIPVQSWIVKRSYATRTKSMIFTDRRVKLIQQLLSGIRVIKFFAWEVPFLNILYGIRKNELRYIRCLLLIRAFNNAVAASFPILATILAFICYSLSGHSLNPGIIFSSLSLFQLLRTPVMLLPISLSSITDAYNALSRLYYVFVAETASDDRIMDPNAEAAVTVKHASFTWEVSASTSDETFKAKRKENKKKSQESPSEKKLLPDTVSEIAVFRLDDVNMVVPRGQLCAIVGHVGSGKSSLLQGLIGEMRKTQGTVTFGGSLSYCPQSAWIQNGTVRENICFGKPFDSERYWKAIHDSCLEADLALLDHGDLTEIGEKGISLSGGQKQRLNICRSIYADTDIQIFDDPLSALDAHVGKDVFQNVLRSNGQKTTRILVTHALHFLPQVDFIITMSDGHIAEQGTFEQLMANEEGAFAKFIKEFERQKNEEAESAEEEENTSTKNSEPSANKEVKAPAKALMQMEERAVGSVSGPTYSTYFAAGKGQVILPLIFASLFLSQAFNVFSSYWLVYWEERKWPESQGFYIGIYSGLGIAQAAATFFLGSLFAMQAYFASRELHRASVERVIHAPTSFFETTPLGRIMNRFSKDSLDNLLGDAWSSAAQSLASIIGAIVLIAAVFPYFLIPVIILTICYFYFSLFFRASARELNRLNSILRSTLVSHFSESLSGLPTIRAYGEVTLFQSENEKRIDNENRWLAIRLDVLGTLLIFIVAMLAVLGRSIITPSQTGIMLSYILSIQSSLSLVVRQGAGVETLMNSVERIVHYAKEVEQEKYKGDSNLQPPSSWPATGSIEMNDLQLCYRPELPPVLAGLSMRLESGEKLGIVGRTGAGKSSIMVALYRLVEPSSGSIKIDGVDISTLDLEILRRSISIIPQEAVIPGTVRSNLDPFGQHGDAVLWDALKRAHLVPKEADEKSIVTVTHANRFMLDATIDDDGSNLSMGERSLISLARALVKKSRVLVLDEATASVDYETDRKIQDTIAREFRDQTVLCIAHRLHTIIGYDRVCVMDAGRVAELDTPASLSMCNQSGISLDDILLAQKSRLLT
ncbi:P-loop containing nucleoside triphosphate hydrolase protein [Gymnopilus junonius]|uniref:P-loop containing nucleoside triphosphate hydrolase protein n=1 Tax=Gymnopilus junonius TaxID=109634 RepID=A0A9P5NWU0_GYMJU|nr:P-loop containing nucleoside triphosphate hydrolase protein [Gymnopilus junonius]